MTQPKPQPSQQSIVDRIVAAVLYEGYILYPYRPSTKNRQRWTFGGLVPESCAVAGTSDIAANQTQCLVIGSGQTRLRVSVRFLHLTDRKVGELLNPVENWKDGDVPACRLVDSLQIGKQRYQAWQEAVEREVLIDAMDMAKLIAAPIQTEFSFPELRAIEPLTDSSGRFVAQLIRQTHAVKGSIDVSAEDKGSGLFQITVRISNRTPIDNSQKNNRDEMMMRSLASTHAVLNVEAGEFISSTDPPDHLRAAADACENVGVWPVLVGEPSQKDTLLASPIILYDYPQIAPESPGDFFDGLEMDEMLTLRIMTMTEDEKEAMMAVDQRARALLERTESQNSAQIAQLHGAIRGMRPTSTEQP